MASWWMDLGQASDIHWQGIADGWICRGQCLIVFSCMPGLNTLASFDQERSSFAPKAQLASQIKPMKHTVGGSSCIHSTILSIQIFEPDQRPQEGRPLQDCRRQKCLSVDLHRAWASPALFLFTQTARSVLSVTLSFHCFS